MYDPLPRLYLDLLAEIEKAKRSGVLVELDTAKCVVCNGVGCSHCPRVDE